MIFERKGRTNFSLKKEALNVLKNVFKSSHLKMLEDKKLAWLALYAQFMSPKQKKIPISLLSNKK